MIHPFTLACALLAVGAGAWAYDSKHDSQMLDRKINSTMKQVDEVRGRTGMLRAEYALLNDPARLQELADQVLSLKTTQPPQFAKLADLAIRLPAVGSGRPPESEVPAMPIASAAPSTERGALDRVASYQPVSSQTPAPAPTKFVARPLAASAPSVQLAASQYNAPQAPAVVQSRPALARQQAAPIAAWTPSAGGIERTPLAPPEPAARSRVVAAAPVHAAAPMMMPAPMAPTQMAPVATYRQARTEMPPATTAEAISRIARGGPVDPSVPVVASALGMARSMTPTAPIGSANAASYGQRPNYLPNTGVRN
jgi:hypothetical protein